MSYPQQFIILKHFACEHVCVCGCCVGLSSAAVLLEAVSSLQFQGSANYWPHHSLLCITLPLFLLFPCLSHSSMVTETKN